MKVQDDGKGDPASIFGPGVIPPKNYTATNWLETCQMKLLSVSFKFVIESSAEDCFWR